MLTPGHSMELMVYILLVVRHCHHRFICSNILLKGSYLTSVFTAWRQAFSVRYSGPTSMLFCPVGEVKTSGTSNCVSSNVRIMNMTAHHILNVTGAAQ